MPIGVTVKNKLITGAQQADVRLNGGVVFREILWESGMSGTFSSGLASIQNSDRKGGKEGADFELELTTVERLSSEYCMVGTLRADACNCCSFSLSPTNILPSFTASCLIYTLISFWSNPGIRIIFTFRILSKYKGNSYPMSFHNDNCGQS